MIEVSVGLFAHDEEANIDQALRAILSQKGRFRIREVLVVSSSTDATDQKVLRFKDPRVRLIKERERNGKCSAINRFLAVARGGILIVESADTLPEQGCFGHLLSPFADDQVGMTNARPIPIPGESIIWTSVGNLIWDLHHFINLMTPKVGELIAFRNIIPKITRTAVDEEAIATLFKRMGYRIVYCPRSKVYNKPPQTLSDFLCQRRRIHCGHLQLRSDSGMIGSVPSLDAVRVLRAFALAARKRKKGFIIGSAAGIIGEMAARSLGRIDYLRGNDCSTWKQARTTKDLGSI